MALIEPRYPKSGRRTHPSMPWESVLRISFMQQWYATSGPAMENALHEIAPMRRFAGLEPIEDCIPY